MSDPLGIVRTPDRPGPGPTPEALLRALDVIVRRRIEAMLTGDHRSSAIGIGTELAQIRLYQPGDDVRRIDWAVTARTGEVHVRDQVAERALVSWLVLDTSPSMSFGTADRRKADVAEGVALAVGHVGTRHGNRLGLITFGDASPITIPSRQGRAGLLGMLATVRREPQLEGAGATSLGEALARTGRLASSRSLIFVVSDFRAVAGRPGDRPPAPGRHQPAPAAGAVRGRRRERTVRAGRPAAVVRGRPCRAVDGRRLAAQLRRLPAPPHHRPRQCPRPGPRPVGPGSRPRRRLRRAAEPGPTRPGPTRRRRRPPGPRTTGRHRRAPWTGETGAVNRGAVR
jgi:Mg-chelatase subunit ChlD